ncbi:MAG TPA: hypothetical protein PLV46_30295 [Reyranella sp.]|uniref:hypothetical protein n=1 Tax=Reyranella sp. TaxID=1929291 RepID=UPI002BD6CE03|nr:hypothetical protein [Reyranella sp.]HQT15770.1 hypothetical protein [Reyranella sp.]
MTLTDLHHSIIEDAIERVQPIVMPVVAITIAGLISILEQRRSLRDHAAYRRADYRWHGFSRPDDARCHFGDPSPVKR